MVTIRHIKYIGFSALILLIYFIALYLIESYYINPNHEIPRFLETIIGSISAGLFAGILAIYGVIFTLDYQEIEQKSEIESHKKMFLTQLEFTHDFIVDLPSKGDANIYGGRIVYDSDWPKHLQYINLSGNDLRTIVDWFHLIHRIEIEANKNWDGSIAADSIHPTFGIDLDKHLPKIKKIMTI